jgi:hypothetical protein
MVVVSWVVVELVLKNAFVVVFGGDVVVVVYLAACASRV